MGRMTGLEPANGGTTTHCLNHLATFTLIKQINIVSTLYIIYTHITNLIRIWKED